MSEFVQFFFNGLVTGSILAIAAVGISLVYGVLKIVNFAGGDFMTFAAFISVFLSVTEHVPIIISGVIAISATILLGLGFEWLLLKRLRKSNAGTLALFLTAFGISLILRQLILIVFGSQARQYDINQVKTYEVFGALIPRAQLIVLICASLTIVALGLVMAKTNIGKDMRAYSDNPSLASISGINVARIVIAVWVINGIVSALAGIFQGVVQGSFTSNMGWSLLLPIFAAVVLGTIGDVYGALLGGMTLGLAMELSQLPIFFGGVPSSYKPVVAFAALAVVLVVRPEGLLGVKARKI